MIATATPSAASWEQAEREALHYLRELIRIDTANPPGNERPAAELCARALAEVGLSPRLLERTPGRTNIVARLRGDGTLPPLLLNAHLDTVPANRAEWSCPPLGAEERGGWIYGRGAIDMKHMAALCLTVMRTLARQATPLRRDVIFCGSADEEQGSEEGALWLVKQHAELIRAEAALGEVGGFSLHLAGQTFYPVMVAQKGVCWFTLRARGPGGHGALPRPDAANVRLAQAVAALGRTRLPPHATPELQEMLSGFAKGTRHPWRWALRLLARPLLGPWLLRALGDAGLTQSLSAVISNTAAPTVLRAGDKENVQPATSECVVDGRTLPGETRESFLRELRAVVGGDLEIEVAYERPPVSMDPHTPLFEVLARTVSELHPGARAVPTLLPGYTDADAFSQLGCTFYGFSPVQLPADGPAFSSLFHAPDERIPVAGFLWGLRALHLAVSRYCER